MAEFAGKVRYTGNATGRVALEIKALEHSHLCDAAFVPAVFKDNIFLFAIFVSDKVLF